MQHILNHTCMGIVQVTVDQNSYPGEYEKMACNQVHHWQVGYLLFSRVEVEEMATHLARLH